MKPARTSLIVALFAFFGGLGVLESSADAQVDTGDFTRSSQDLYYLIQVEYARPAYHYGGTGGYGHHGGHYGGSGRYTYKWETVFDTTDPEEAKFVFTMFRQAEDDGSLDEIAPDIGYKWSPTRVRVVRMYRDVGPTLSTSR